MIPASRRSVLGTLTSLPLIGVAGAGPAGAADDPLPSWNDGPAKAALAAFVAEVTTEGDPGFVPAAERIAVFDNDGTLWCEQPAYTQAIFAFDRIKALAPQHPEWREREPFRSVLAGDLAGVAATGEKGVLELVMASHAGTTTDEFARIVAEWIATARHPRFGRPYTAMTYQPMLEVLAYVRSRGFKTYIVSGGGVEFMRPWAEAAYGIPPEQVIGSSIKTRYAVEDGRPVLMRLPEIEFIDDGPGKPAGINRYIGRRPIAAFGNSDGDLQMLQWTTAGDGPRLGLIVHHDDAEREYAYDRDSKVGRLDKALDEAPGRGWLVASMRDDWRTVFAPAQ